MTKLTDSIALSMANQTVIDVNWDKGKCDTYRLSAYGFFFLGQMHPTGRALLSFTIKKCHQDLMFLYCRDRGCSNWAPCAQSIKKFNIISPGVNYCCELNLMIAITYDDKKYALKYNYPRWKGHLGEYDSISQAISMLNRLDIFICHVFTLR